MASVVSLIRVYLRLTSVSPRDIIKKSERTAQTREPDMNLNQIAESYGTTVEQYVNGAWITVEVEVTEVAEVTETEVTEVAEFLSEVTPLVVTKSGPSKIIASLRAFGLSVKDIANQVGVSVSTVYRWSNVRNWPLDHNYNNLIMVAGRI